MSKVFKMSTAFAGLLAAAGIGLAGSAASAADLGGDCCADLEERIAELEATTARKGNRKVKLEISGHVNEAIIFWDDGVESNQGVYTNDAARTRFRFKGDAKITDDLKAGYLIEIGSRAANSKRFDQDDPNGLGDDPNLDLRHSVWYLDSKTFGRVWVGQTGGASEGVTEINLAQTGSALKYSDPEDLAGGLDTRVNGARQGQSWRRLIGADGSGTSAGEGNRYQMVRYDTPEFGGFTGTVNWGADDTWEAGLRFKGEFSDFKMAAGIAYGENSDGSNEPGNDCAVSGLDVNTDCSYVGGSVSVMHTPSGIYGNFAAGEIDDNNVGAGLDNKYSFYAFEAGIEQKWTSLGKTTIFGQYYKTDGGFLDRDFAVFNEDSQLSGSEMEGYGFGLAQGIDAAAMTMYVLYRHTEGDITDLATGTTVSLDDVDAVVAGALIKF